MRDDKDAWNSIMGATGIDDREAARKGHDYELPKGCWILMGYSLALVWGVGGILLLFILLRFALIRRVFSWEGLIAVVVVSMVMIAGSIFLGITTTKSLR